MNGVPNEDRQEQCSIALIPLPESSSPIVEIKASNSRSYVKRQNGEYWYWGGLFFGNGHQEFIRGFNLLQEEPGLEDKKISAFEMGFGHCVVMTDENAQEPIQLDL